MQSHSIIETVAREAATTARLRAQLAQTVADARGLYWADADELASIAGREQVWAYLEASLRDLAEAGEQAVQQHTDAVVLYRVFAAVQHSSSAGANAVAVAAQAEWVRAGFMLGTQARAINALSPERD